jgi:hypothetical protein
MFTVVHTPSAQLWQSVLGLSAEIANPCAVFDCAHGCGYSRITGYQFWVDFGAGTIQRDTRTKNCTGAPASAGGGVAGDGSGRKAVVRHARVDFTASAIAPRLTSTDPPRTAASADEFLLEHMAESKRLAFVESHALSPTTWTAHVTALQMAASRLAAAMSVAAWAALVAGDGTLVRRSAVLASASAADADRVEARILCRNAALLNITMRGLAEVATHLQATFWAVYDGAGASAKAFYAAMTEQWRPELAEVRDAVTRPDHFFADLASRLDANPFAIVGLAAAGNDKPALAAFWRTERARYDAAAKTLGIKAVAAKGGSGGGGGGGGAVPSPDRTGRDGGAGGGGGDDTGAGDGVRGRGKVPPSAASETAPPHKKRKGKSKASKGRDQQKQKPAGGAGDGKG